MEAAKALPNRHICTGYCVTAISTKFKCAGSFDLPLVLNQAKLNKEIITIEISMKVTIC